MLLLSSIGVALIGLFAVPEPGFSRAITELLNALPGHAIRQQLLAALDELPYDIWLNVELTPR